MKKFLIISAVLFGVVSTENCFCMDDEDVNIRKSATPVSGKWKLQMKAVITTDGMVSNEQQSRTLTRKLLDFSKKINVLKKENKSLEDAKNQLVEETTVLKETLNEKTQQEIQFNSSITALENRLNDEKQQFEDRIKSIESDRENVKNELTKASLSHDASMAELKFEKKQLEIGLKNKSKELDEQTRYISDMKTFDKCFNKAFAAWVEASKDALCSKNNQEDIVENKVKECLETVKAQEDYDEVLQNITDDNEQLVIEDAVSHIYSQVVPSVDYFDASFISFKENFLNGLRDDESISVDPGKREEKVIEIMIFRGIIQVEEYYKFILGDSYHQSIREFLNSGDEEIIDVITRSALSISSQTI